MAAVTEEAASRISALSRTLKMSCIKIEPSDQCRRSLDQSEASDIRKLFVLRIIFPLVKKITTVEAPTKRSSDRSL